MDKKDFGGIDMWTILDLAEGRCERDLEAPEEREEDQDEGGDE